MKSMRFLLITVAAITATAQICAAEAPRDRTSELAAAKHKVASAAFANKGGVRQKFELEQRRLQDLIDDLEAGKRVNPEEIDRALKDADSPVR